MIRPFGELLDARDDPPLLFGQSLRSVQRITGVALQPGRSVPLDQATRVPQLVQCCDAFRQAVASGTCCGPTHSVGRLLKSPRGPRELRQGLFPRQTLEPTGELLRFGGELTLTAATGLTLRVSRPGSHPLVLGLLPPGELLQLLHHLVDLIVQLLAPPAL